MAFEHGKDLREGNGTNLHVAQRKLFASDPAREIVHQFLFAHSEALDDAGFLPLEWFALEDLGNAPAKKIEPRLHVLFEGIRLAARQSQQSRTVRQFEIVHVAAVERLFGGRMKLFDHAGDGSAAAGSGQPAHKNVVTRGGKLHAHLQRTQRAFLPNEALSQLGLRSGFKRDARKLTRPPQFRYGKLHRFRGRFGGHEIPSSALL